MPIKALLFTVVVAASTAAGCAATVKHDLAATATPASDTQVKCACYPCECPQNPPPPPPPPPKWPVPYCPPPPPPLDLDIIGTPAHLYPFDPSYYPSSARRSFPGTMPVFLLSGLFALLKLWWP